MNDDTRNKFVRSYEQQRAEIQLDAALRLLAKARDARDFNMVAVYAGIVARDAETINAERRAR